MTTRTKRRPRLTAEAIRYREEREKDGYRRRRMVAELAAQPLEALLHLLTETKAQRRLLRQAIRTKRREASADAR